MYHISDVFEKNHAQTMMKKSLNESSNVWKSWGEEDATLIRKVSRSVWVSPLAPLVSVTDEIMKSYADSWSSAERIELIEYDTSINKTRQERIENKSTEMKKSVSQETYELLYLNSFPQYHGNQKTRYRGYGIQ